MASTSPLPTLKQLIRDYRPYLYRRHVCIALAVTLSILFFYTSCRIFDPAVPAAIARTSAGVDYKQHPETIPNIVHFVYLLQEANADFGLEFSHFLAIYSAHHYWKPDSIYLHTNGDARNVQRARDGQKGKWNKLIFNLPELKINAVTAPTHADNGYNINGTEHKSDFVRVKVVHDQGGVYMDWDVHALKDMRLLRSTPFQFVVGRAPSGRTNSGIFMSVPKGVLIQAWRSNMHRVYDGQWLTHSDELLTHLAQNLTRDRPGAVLIAEKDALNSFSFREEDFMALFGSHGDKMVSNLEGISQGDPLPSFPDETKGGGDKDVLRWVRSWASSYCLHAFRPSRFGSEKILYRLEPITPRYVLSRTSNYSRAVYPLAKHLYDQGVIGLDDPHTG